MKKVIFFDIDGTLAMGTQVPASAKQAIKQTRAAGNKVFICSGRAISYIQKYFSDYADGYIAFNGRQAFSKDHIIFDHPVDDALIHHIIDVLRHYHMGFTLFDDQHGYFEGREQDFADINTLWAPGFLRRGIPEKFVAYGIDIFFENEAQFQNADAALPECTFNRHYPHLSADTSFGDFDKGTAILDVAKLLDIDRKDTYAFGDGTNDVEMLKAAGHGIAMGNAVEVAKQAADYVTTRLDQDGVRNGLKHYELI